MIVYGLDQAHDPAGAPRTMLRDVQRRRAARDRSPRLLDLDLLRPGRARSGSTHGSCAATAAPRRSSAIDRCAPRSELEAAARAATGVSGLRPGAVRCRRAAAGGGRVRSDRPDPKRGGWQAYTWLWTIGAGSRRADRDERDVPVRAARCRPRLVPRRYRCPPWRRSMTAGWLAMARSTAAGCTMARLSASRRAHRSCATSPSRCRPATTRSAARTETLPPEFHRGAGGGGSGPRAFRGRSRQAGRVVAVE